MEAIKAVLPMLIALSLAGLVLKVGLDADPDDIFYLWRRPAKLLKAILAVNVIVPVAGIAAVLLLPSLSTAAKIGIALMAISPVPPLVPGKQLKVGGPKSYAYSLYVGLALLAIVVVPLWVEILAVIFGVDAGMPALDVARNAAVTVVAPLAVGMLVRRLAPAFAARAHAVVGGVATVLLLVALVPILIVAWPAMIAISGDGTLAVMAGVVIVGLAAGHLLGGSNPEERSALAVTAATRHPGLALMIARANTDHDGVVAVIVAFLLVGMVVGIPYQALLKRAPARQPST